jgi:hypothetical protein
MRYSGALRSLSDFLIVLLILIPLPAKRREIRNSNIEIRNKSDPEETRNPKSEIRNKFE